MKTGVYGGTFDPVHLGHLILAEACRDALQLDRVLFVVAGHPPHKPDPAADAHPRAEMVRLAIAGHPAFQLSDIEARRPGPHYSFETLAALQLENPADDLFFLIGADSLIDLPHWREPNRVASLATVVVVNRPGLHNVADLVNRVDLGPNARPIQIVDAPLVDIASKDIRARLAARRSIRFLVPRAVEEYLKSHRLYQS